MGEAVKSPGPDFASRRFLSWKWIILGIFVFIATVVGIGVDLAEERTTKDPKPGGPGDNSTLWTPAAGTPWQIVLQGKLAYSATNPTVSPANIPAYDLDMFTNPATTFSTLQKKLGIRVICYFSAGSYEPGRPDSGKFPKAVLGDTIDGWPDEKWLDIRADAVRKIMAARIRLASAKGCDAIDPDNVDGYENENGFDLTAEDSVNFVRFLAAEASKYNLAIGLKNAGEIVKDVLDVIQFSVNEQCAQYKECKTFSPVIRVNKPVFHIEYPTGAPGQVPAAKLRSLCGSPGTASFSTVMKTMDLDGWVQYCNGKQAKTSVE